MLKILNNEVAGEDLARQMISVTLYAHKKGKNSLPFESVPTLSRLMMEKHKNTLILVSSLLCPVYRCQHAFFIVAPTMFRLIITGANFISYNTRNGSNYVVSKSISEIGEPTILVASQRRLPRRTVTYLCHPPMNEDTTGA